MLQEYALVKLRADKRQVALADGTQGDLEAGTPGTVVGIYPHTAGSGFAVEFVRADGSTLAITIVQEEELLPRFIAGKLLVNASGATYEGRVYDRRLRVQLHQGSVISVFDPMLLSTDLQVNEQVELALVPFASGVQPGTGGPAAQSQGEWEGVVAECGWAVPAGLYRSAPPCIFANSRWGLLSTVFGHVLMRESQLQQTFRPGERVRWTHSRLDLYAVV